MFVTVPDIFSARVTPRTPIWGGLKLFGRLLKREGGGRGVYSPNVRPGNYIHVIRLLSVIFYDREGGKGGAGTKHPENRLMGIVSTASNFIDKIDASNRTIDRPHITSASTH